MCMLGLHDIQTGAKPPLLRLSPFRIAAIYASAGFLWIYFSDSLLQTLTPNPGILTTIEILKGWMYVGVTAFILYLLIRSFERTQLESEQQYRTLLEQASDGILIFDKN